ncbi:MAG: chromosome partitioning protein Smc [Paenibacillus sp.]|jgi:chromosome segregation protein|nr:chromosome partitioning protein Smc [Paenibacillus sp.]
MFLKRLELAGFKSFADKTELEFVPGITAVVGPNGSGKSNISDSIRWVLGEQSARSLRGGKMEDIIFAGSDARKAVNYGEVSLTLDNSDESLSLDFSEVTVTRRIHRSGDSEYFINKQSCRLKDITELFMDTGIGKEAYSIIGQGRIEEILSTKSEDRRGIFEEASGIVKYKSRKREAEKKLGDTEQNLLRIHDLISELEDQLEPLRVQSEKAVRYKQLKEQLKSSEVSMYVHQIEQIHISWMEANNKLTELQQEQVELSTVVSRHDALLEKERMEARRLEEEIDQLHEHVLRLSEEYEKCEGHGELLKERGKNLQTNQAQLEQTLSGQQERISAKYAETAEFRGKYATLERELEQIRARLTAEEERLLGVSVGVSSAAEDDLKADYVETLNKIAHVRNDIRFAEQSEESLARRLERMDEEYAKWAVLNKQIASKREQLQRRANKLASELQESREGHVSLSQELKSRQEAMSQLQESVRRTEQRLEALTSRRDTMRELQNDYDGFAQGVKEVLKAKSRPDGLKGIHGAVAELVKVPANVEIAIDTALGGAQQNVVVENEAFGREAIQFLKRRQAGRATFLPLDVIRGRSIPDHESRQLGGMSGFVGIAVELVRFDERYANIMSSLLGHVIIADKLEAANRIAAKCQYRYRVVTLEGDVVNPGGSMTGGSLQKKTSSLLGRNRQIEEMNKEIAGTNTQLKEHQIKLEQLRREQSEGTRKLDELRQLGEKLRIDEQHTASELTQLLREGKQAAEQEAVYSQDRESLNQERRSFMMKKQQAELALLGLHQEESGLQQAIRDAELLRKAKESAKEELQGQLTSLKVRSASLSQEKQSLEEQLRRFEEDLSAAERDRSMNRRLLQNVVSDMKANEAESVKQIEQFNHLRLKKQEASEQMEFKRAERAKWVQKLEEGQSLTKEQRTMLKLVEDQLRQTEVRVTRLDVELENLLKKLAEDYELSFELAKERYPVPDNVQAVSQEVKELKRQIQSLGTVNLGAIEEYERVNERFQFLSGQKRDLVEAKTALYVVIREMDEEMSKRFKVTFDAIRAQFVGVFVKLFGGGRADLILSEPDKLLDTGIEIVAQPPGKKLQNLQLLSGGERALTAMALLFSILRVKPVPFCVLDEVEAALDEANVSRFADYLREFSEQTQFIVVTHRKGTMESADVLYGVTMEEGGVSKLVSVRLDDNSLTA